MRSALTLAARLARPLTLDRQLEFWLRRVNSTWSLGDVHARVVGVIAETKDTKTFVLRPNAHWRGHRAGQHTTVEVEAGGVRLRRCYSISSAPGAPPAITVKRAGRVSSWLHDHVHERDVLRLAPADGDFVLPHPAPHRLLLVAGGSGVTPLMSMLRDLDARDAVGDVVLVHHARSDEDVIFGRELRSLAARHRTLRVHICLSDGSRGPGRFDEARFRRLVPDFAERDTFLCGPPGLMERVELLWADAGATPRLRRERFVAYAPPVPRGVEDARITLTTSGRSFVASGEGTLLEQLERAGVRPRSGCRIGICQTCRCRKRSGVVEDLRTGAVSSEPDQDVQPCVSIPRSNVELCL
jgi:ferredoxin-NADP reductase